MAKNRPPFSPKSPFWILDRKWPKVNIRLVLSYGSSLFLFRPWKDKKNNIAGVVVVVVIVVVVVVGQFFPSCFSLRVKVRWLKNFAFFFFWDRFTKVPLFPHSYSSYQCLKSIEFSYTICCQKGWAISYFNVIPKMERDKTSKKKRYFYVTPCRIALCIQIWSD